MRRILVQNVRPRRHVVLFGRVLAAARPSRKQSAGTLWVYGDRIAHPNLVRLFGLGRLRIIAYEGLSPRELSDLLPGVSLPELPEVAPEVIAEPEPVPAPAFEVGSSPTQHQRASGGGRAKPDQEVGAGTPPNLKAMGYRDLQAHARDLGLSAAGKRGDLLARIQEYYEEQS